MEREIIYAKEVERFLDELLIILFKKDYFGFPDSAKTYVDRIFDYVEQNTGILPGHAAPSHFSKYAKNMSYIIYRANKSTVWYILYQRRDVVLYFCERAGRCRILPPFIGNSEGVFWLMTFPLRCQSRQT